MATAKNISHTFSEKEIFAGKILVGENWKTVDVNVRFSICWQIFLVSQCYQAECVQNEFQFEICRVLKQKLQKFTTSGFHFIIIVVW